MKQHSGEIILVESWKGGNSIQISAQKSWKDSSRGHLLCSIMGLNMHCWFSAKNKFLSSVSVQEEVHFPFTAYLRAISVMFKEIEDDHSATICILHIWIEYTLL